ncbi:MAG: ATP-dependent RecD-like DNA helicase [Lachnospiraceae bacterium]|nr:ATP-dependent RecD-like DNA helicase [Lachnospiraceae bacterium]
MAEVEGYIERIIYRSEDTGYTVLSLLNGGKESCLVGVLPSVSEGEYVTASGEVVVHPVYGEQIRVQEFAFSVPSDKAGMELYLGSGAIKGIGPALAKRIIKKFGEDTFRIMEEEPERLAEIKGISERRALEVASQMLEKREGRKAMLFLQKYGISWNMGMKIYNQYGNELYRIIQENPYRLADDITGIGFKIADEIASKAGIVADSEFRIRSGILYTLQQAVGQGHTYLPVEILIREAANLLQVEGEQVEKYMMDLTIDRKLLIRNVKVKEGEEAVQKAAYLSHYYYLELNTARMLCDLDIRAVADREEIARTLENIEADTGIALDEIQREAVRTAVEQGLMILTGGPGTGKTTTINAIIRYFEEEDMEVLLAAPTGRAAKRMSEATGREAKTIHRLLEIAGPSEQQIGDHANFGRDEENPLEADVVIIDEMSMVDISLMHALLKAVPVGCRLILVGDVNQLPSVGPGNVLKDIIDSGCFQVVRLTRIFRQAAESDIILNAHRINGGEPVDVNRRSKDFLFVKRENAGNIVGASITLVREKLPAYVQARPQDIQVLTPMRKGNLGVEQLNVVLQEQLNPPAPGKQEKTFPQGVFREGDKVMQIRNNYQMEWEITDRHNIPMEKGVGVFNGDTGIIREVNLFAEELVVEFEDQKKVHYPFKQAEELELAYAVTIHKSQGSEYPAVVIPLLSGPRMLMNRNLLYTAVTRARQCVCIVGSVSMFQEMVANERVQWRYSGLGILLQELRSDGLD